MQEEDRTTLRKNREALLKDLEAKRVASLLYSREIFSEEDKDTVNAETTALKQRETLLDTLPRKGPKAFRVFCDILHEVTPHLEQLLRPVQEDGKPSEGTDGPGNKAPIPVSEGPSEQNDQVDHPFRSGGYNVKPSPTQFDPNTMYRMNRSPRGIAVIINNKNFLESSGQHMAQRGGTDVDRDALKKLFKKLQFKVEVYNNKTKAEIRQIAMEKADFNHSIYDAFIFTILTHGEEGLLYGTDGTISIKDITSRFKYTKTLAGKPKIFFFQACQGQEFMDGMDAPDGPQKPTEKVSVPVEADFIYAYSTVPGYYSWRNNTDGSWFIQSVVEVFQANAHHMDILQMLTRVNDKLSYFKSRNMVAKNKMQVGCTVSMLTKDLYFFQDKGAEQNNSGDTEDNGGSACQML